MSRNCQLTVCDDRKCLNARLPVTCYKKPKTALIFSLFFTLKTFPLSISPQVLHSDWEEIDIVFHAYAHF